MTPDTARLFTLPALLLILSYLLIPCYTSFYSDFILPSHTILYWFYLTFSYHAILLSILILSYLLIPCYTSFYSDFILPSHTMLYFYLFWFYLTFLYHAILLSILILSYLLIPCYTSFYSTLLYYVFIWIFTSHYHCR